jgi:hypothetical protein
MIGVACPLMGAHYIFYHFIKLQTPFLVIVLWLGLLVREKSFRR